MIFYCVELDTLLLLTVSDFHWKREFASRGVFLGLVWESEKDLEGFNSETANNYTYISLGAI